jgi:4-hydroxymandelate oxidase
MNPSVTHEGRRQFLRLLAGSPLMAFGGLHSGLLERLGGVALSAQEDTGIISSLDEALEIMDFEPVAKRMMLPQHWAYLATGVDDDATLRANVEGFSNYQIRMRRLVDFTTLDLSTEIFGKRWASPLAFSPVASLKGFHTQGEPGAARAASAKGVLQMLSTQTSTPVEEVNEAYGEPIWYQLYARSDWENTSKLVKRVETAGCPVLVFTIDLLAGRNTVTNARAQGLEGTSAEFCQNCHKDLTKPMAEGLTRVPGVTNFTWDYVKRLKDSTSMKLVLKGIVTQEDAELAVEFGADGVMVSNHGGRGAESLRPTIECLPEVAAGVAGRVPVLFDSGVRRGTHILKALALGADVVSVGRPYVWGLAGFGQDGVEKVIDILHRELQLVMRQAGATSIQNLRQNRYILDRRTGARL